MNKKDRLKEHYNSKYNNSDFSKVNPIEIVKHPANRFQMAARIISENNGKYLEIGAGSGNVALTALEFFEEIVLTELSINRANELKKLFGNYEKVKIIVSNIEDENLEYPDNYFDIICMTAIIEHLIDPINVLKELYRLLKPGGKLLIDTPNIAKITRRIKLLFGYFPSTASIREGLLMYDKKTDTDLYDEGHLHYFTFRSLDRLLRERIGFKKVTYFGYGNFKTMKVPGFLSRIYPTLFSEIFITAEK